MDNSTQKPSKFYSVLRILAIPIFKALYFFNCNGKSNVPEYGKCIICANHTSLKDPLFLALSIKRQIFFMGKSELFKNKLFSKIILKLGAFPVSRGKHDVKSILNTEALLQSQKAVGIFIEGTRSKNGKLLKPKSGAAMIAYKTNTPIIPIGISQKNGKIPSIFHKVTINVGSPLTPQELGMLNGTSLEYRNASRKIMDEIKKLIEKNTGKEA